MRQQTPRQRLRTAIDSFLYNWPMFANIVLKWELVECTDRPTMATNGKQLFYNPDFVLDNTTEENAWVVLHEAGHCFLGHHIRLLGAVPDIANIAFDLALNALIRAICPLKFRMRMVFAGQGDYAEFPPDKDAETYYARLTQPESPEDDQGASQSQDPCPDTSEQSGDALDEPGDNQDGPRESSDTQSGQSQGQEGDAGKCPINDSEGPEATGTPPDDKNASQGKPGGKESTLGRPSHSSYQGFGDVEPCPDINTPAQKAEAEGKWQQTVAESIALGEMCGNCPGWFKAIGEQLLGKSDVDWRLILRQFMTKYVPTGSTFSRPNRRSSWRRDVILPAHRSRGGGKGLLIVDVSGSTFDQINEVVMPEVEKILTTLLKTTVTMMQVDTEVRAERVFERYDFPLRMPVEWKGGGGTNLNPGFEKAKKDAAKYRWVICITDFEWAFLQAPNPGLPVLWVAVGTQSTPEPKFGRLVTVK